MWKLTHTPLKCRIDCFSEVHTSLFGEKLKEQVEERLMFYDQGKAPGKNSEAMKVVLSYLLSICWPKTNRGYETLYLPLLPGMRWVAP
jgi:hypothetical protein